MTNIIVPKTTEKLKNFKKIKEYDTFILFEHKSIGYRECFLKTEVKPEKNEIKLNTNKGCPRLRYK